ncbi:dTDP-4-dehydrorhamnose 3,5-epimerase [Microtetraspora sp. NBRC 13810]|uniref:dTDP-4-dehydrorhamnose 3,5-epimerase family protein n=1 Tax=Microtetraspora sp. NBRC 13810 TaxID=3030990 RepID=UPI002555F38B|nr:dTDP-4-dehydrorhamnose 3,5-epimerase family protein [Microtetraspora sp. NBRC 13810]GLW08792.1 dTDP-4-dehydrorhamnose 3,5-epimerase [Microtetraspora sp. NBRC 13810]
MRIEKTALDGVLLFVPTPHRDARGLFTRVFDAGVAAAAGLDPAAFVQDSQSRSRSGTVRGLHGRAGRGEAKLVRCARGAVYDVVVDARPASPTFGSRFSVVLDDDRFAVLYVPPGFLHGFQALTGEADVCYRIDREHDPAEDLTVRYDDPDLAVDWPLPVSAVSERDLAAGSWARLGERLRATE